MTVAESLTDTANPLAVTWARRASVLGAVLIALFVLTVLLPANPEAHAACGHWPDVLAFELARTPADLAALFGPPGSACADAMTAAMDWINRIDLPFFIAAYVLFLCAVSLFESARQRQRRWLWGLLFAAVALAGDLLETTLLLQITRQLDDPAALLTPLWIATWIKWIGLGAFGGLAAYCGWTASPRRWLLILPGVLTVGATVAAAGDASRFASLMVLSSALLWVVLWLRAVRASGWIGTAGPV